VDALVLLGGLLKGQHGRMPRLYRSEEPHSDLSADGPYHLDREPVTGQQFNRYMFSDCDPEGAVDAKAAPQVIHDYDASTEPIMAVQERGNANRPSNALPTFMQDLRLPRHGCTVHRHEAEGQGHAQ
jgi:hypothetical protein